MIRGKLEAWLDRRLGDYKTPNLRSRIFWCEPCSKHRNVKDLQTGKCLGHKLWERPETFMNYLKSLL